MHGVSRHESSENFPSFILTETHERNSKTKFFYKLNISETIAKINWAITPKPDEAIILSQSPLLLLTQLRNTTASLNACLALRRTTGNAGNRVVGGISRFAGVLSAVLEEIPLEVTRPMVTPPPRPVRPPLPSFPAVPVRRLLPQQPRRRFRPNIQRGATRERNVPIFPTEEDQQDMDLDIFEFGAPTPNTSPEPVPVMNLQRARDSYNNRLNEVFYAPTDGEIDEF